MLAARIYEAKDLRVVETPLSEFSGSDKVRVKISAAGICGSDLHVYHTGDYLTRTPITMGHEFAGKVLAVGEHAHGFQVGDHVVGDSRVWCDECEYCAEKKYNLCEKLGFLGEVCEGAFAEEIVLPAHGLIKIDGRVPWHVAALAEPLAVALHVIKQSQMTGVEKVLILGAGPIGALIHAALKIQGNYNLTITDISEYRRQAIEKLGGLSKVASNPKGVYDLVFETTGAVSVLQHLLPKILRKGGQSILVGLFAKESPFNFTDIVEKEWQLKGCSCFNDELQAAVDLLETHSADFEHVVSHQLPLSRVQKAFKLLSAPEKNAMKIILKPQESD